jgi:hypothetical protein
MMMMMILVVANDFVNGLVVNLLFRIDRHIQCFSIVRVH